MLNQNKNKDQAIGWRYLPELFAASNMNMDFELSLNAYQNYQGSSVGNYSSTSKIKLYRLWFRYTRNQYELRMGLQKIKFGTAFLLRSLMWFDRIDARDPP